MRYTTFSQGIATTRPGQDSNSELVPTPDQEASADQLRYQSLSSQAQLLHMWRYLLTTARGTGNGGYLYVAVICLPR